MNSPVELREIGSRSSLRSPDHLPLITRRTYIPSAYICTHLYSNITVDRSVLDANRYCLKFAEDYRRVVLSLLGLIPETPLQDFGPIAMTKFRRSDSVVNITSAAKSSNQPDDS